VRGRALVCLPDSYLVNLYPFVVDLPADFMQEIAGQMFGRRVQLDIEWREGIDVPVVEIVDDTPCRILEIFEIDPKADLVELIAAHVDLDAIVVSVRVLTLPTVSAQRMRR